VIQTAIGRPYPIDLGVPIMRAATRVVKPGDADVG